MITKRRYYHLPTYEDFEASLKKVRRAAYEARGHASGDVKDCLDWKK